MAAALRRQAAFEPSTQNADLEVDAGLDAALAQVRGPLITADRADERFDAPPGARFDRALFLSRHRAASGRTALTVHPIGNLGPTSKFGGRPRTLGPPDPAAMSSLLRALVEEARPLKVPATFEATHHGPLMALPSLFVEVGSGPRDWENEELVGAAARAVLLGCRQTPEAEKAPAALGLGGGHYQPKQTDAARTGAAVFGHLIPSHALADLDLATLRAAAEQSRASSAFVDPRGADPAQLERLCAQLDALGIPPRTLGGGPHPPPKL